MYTHIHNLQVPALLLFDSPAANRSVGMTASYETYSDDLSISEILFAVYAKCSRQLVRLLRRRKVEIHLEISKTSSETIRERGRRR